MRALEQKKGIDTIVAPLLVARSGQRSKVEVVREFPYPIEFDPPEIPETIGAVEDIAPDEEEEAVGDGDPEIEQELPSSSPIIPTTPTTFEIRNVGFTLEVEPIVGENNRLIELNLAPEFVRFEGFIDYGSPIENAIIATNINRNENTYASTNHGLYTIDNPILQPIFRSNQVNTSVNVYDGQTVVFAGTMDAVVKKLEDQTPGLGDLPGAGQGFQSTATAVEKKYVVFFVTANIIDPAGKTLRDIDR